MHWGITSILHEKTAVGRMFRREGCCMVHELNAGHQKAIKTANQSLENAAKSKYLGTTTMSETFFHEDFKRTLNSGNACYCSEQTAVSSRLSS
jgi:hypothetical protein